MFGDLHVIFTFFLIKMFRYLMDGLRSEETERYKLGIANHFGVSPKTNQKKMDPVAVKTAKGWFIVNICASSVAVLFCYIFTTVHI